MGFKELEQAFKNEVKEDEKKLATMLLCIRNSAQMLLTRIEKGDRIESCEIDFEFADKVNSAGLYALRAETLRKLLEDIKE